MKDQKDQIEALREQANIARRKIGKLNERNRVLNQKLHSLNRLSELLDKEFEDMTRAELVETRNALQMAVEIVPDVEPRLLLVLVESYLLAYQKYDQHMEMHRREERLRARQEREEFERHNQLDEKLCIVCQKRPRHFDDYCKRCIPDDFRPTGKV